MAADVTVINQGSIVQFVVESDAAQEWIDENVQSEGWQWLGRSLAVDHRYAGDLIDGMANSGLELDLK